MPKPIKRSDALIPISREHHHGLLLSWKIREGLKRGIEVERIKKYTNWFWEHHLQSHFDFEEEYIFPILGEHHDLIKQALSEHVDLKKLFLATDSTSENLKSIEEQLTAHIRFEERVLFNEIEHVATEEEMRIISEAHTNEINENWDDEFWVFDNSTKNI